MKTISFLYPFTGIFFCYSVFRFFIITPITTHPAEDGGNTPGTLQPGLHSSRSILIIPKIYILNIVRSMILSAIALMISGSTVAQQQEILGEWKVNLQVTLKEMTALEKSRYDSLPDLVKQDFSSSFQSRSFLFEAGNAVTISYVSKGVAHEVTGTWSYSVNNSLLTIATEGKTRRYTVDWINDGILQLNFNDISPGAVLSSLCLSRAH